MKLPDKLSDLILVALEDLEKCEADPRYRIDMGAWHEPRGRSSCSVCLAGSVMAKTLETPITYWQGPSCFKDSIARKLIVLDRVRTGRIFLGDKNNQEADWYFIEEQSCLENMPRYNRQKWKLHMLDIVGRLQAEGL